MLKTILKEKINALLIHLLLSTLIISSFMLLVFFVWYPYPFYITEGLSNIAIILIAVDLTLGPLLTFVVYKKGKKHLFFDLTIIALIQFSAFIYGAVIINQERPVYIAYVIDRYQSVHLSTVDIQTLKYPELKYSFFSSPIYIYTKLPSNPQERTDLMWSTISGGKDIDQLPEYYHPYKENLTIIGTKKLTYKKKLSESPELQKQLERIINKKQQNKDNIGLYILKGKEKSVIGIVNLDSGIIFNYLDTDPFINPD